MFPIQLSLAALQAAPQPSVSSPAPQEDIIVIARQLKTVRFSFNTKHGVLTQCKIDHPSGSAFIDKLVCDAAGQCAAEHPDIGARHLTPCITDRIKREVAAHRGQGSVGGATPSE